MIYKALGVAGVIALIGSNMWTASQVYSRVVRHYEQKIAGIEADAKVLLEREKQNNEREVLELQNIVERLKPVGNIDNQRRLCQSDPYCKKDPPDHPDR